MDKNATKLEIRNSKEYKVETIQDSVIYAKESGSGHLTKRHYFVSWKGYLKEENT